MLWIPAAATAPARTTSARKPTRTRPAIRRRRIDRWYAASSPNGSRRERGEAGRFIQLLRQAGRSDTARDEAPGPEVVRRTVISGRPVTPMDGTRNACGWFPGGRPLVPGGRCL